MAQVGGSSFHSLLRTSPPAATGATPAKPTVSSIAVSAPRYRPADGVLADRVDGKIVLVDPGGREVLTLNDTGSTVWEVLAAAGPDGVLRDVVAQRLTEVFDGVEPAQAGRDVDAFLAELVALDLVAAEDGA